MDCRRQRAPADAGPGQRTGAADRSTEPVPAHAPRLVGTRSTASPFTSKDLGRGGTRPYRVVGSGVIGLAALVALAWVGGDVKQRLHLPLPGPVIGLALLAVLCLLAKRFHTRSHRQLTRHLMPTSRLLVAHLGLLFVPAGVGIITMGEAIHKEWLPLVAGLTGSTLIGLLATGWFMHRFAPKTPAPAHES